MTFLDGPGRSAASAAPAVEAPLADPDRPLAALPHRTLPEGDSAGVFLSGARLHDELVLRMGAPAQQPAGMISSRVVVRVVDFAAARGHDPEQLCRSVGLSLDTLRDPNARLPFALAERVGMHAAELCNDPNLGLHLAYDVRDPRRFDAGILLMMASPTLGAGFERMALYQLCDACVYWPGDPSDRTGRGDSNRREPRPHQGRDRERFSADGERFILRPTPDGSCLRHTGQDPVGEYQRHSDECAMAEFVLGARVLTERDIAPRVVRFRHAAVPIRARRIGAMHR